MIRVLFVDDEELVLHGLERMLRAARQDWEMRFVGSGEEALCELDREPFNVVVSDIRLHGMDGLTLLERIKQNHPNVVRMVLSGHADIQTSVQLASVAHRWIAKPSDAETIRESIGRVHGLHQLLTDERLRRLVGGIASLPATERMSNAVSAALFDSDSPVADVARLVAEDPGTCAKVLQLVNSAFFMLPRKVVDTPDAVRMLGLDVIRMLVLSAKVLQAFEGAVAKSTLAALQQHALLTATIARRLIRDPHRAQEAFTAAILHDVGKLILAQIDGAGGAPLPPGSGDGWERECAAFGVSHAEVGAYLLGLWGLPHVIVEAVAFHHRPDEFGAARFDALSIVHVADSLARELDPAGDPETNSARARRLDDHLARLGLLDQLPHWRQIAADIGA